MAPGTRRPGSSRGLGALLVLMLIWMAHPSLADAGLDRYPPRQVEGGIELSMTTPSRGRVTVAGSFNGWSTGSHPLRDRDGDGVSSIVLPLEPGRHEYWLLIDGHGPGRGSRIERQHVRALQSHLPLDMAVHWMVPVFVLHVRPDGSLEPRPEDPARFNFIHAGWLRFRDLRGFIPEFARMARRIAREALELDPGDPWIQRLGYEVELQAIRDERREYYRLMLSLSEPESILAPLLATPYLSPEEKNVARDLVQHASGAIGESAELAELARLARRVHYRGRLSELRRNWRANPSSELARAELRNALERSYVESDLPELERELGTLYGAGWQQKGIEVLLAALRRLALRNWQTEDLDALAEWLVANDPSRALPVLRVNVLPQERKHEAALYLLKRLEGRTEHFSQILFWVLTFTPRLRENLEVRHMLEEQVAAERDPLGRRLLTSRLAYFHLVNHDEDGYYTLLKEALNRDPLDLELLGNLSAFLRTLRRLEREYAGLLVNPWERGLIPSLFRLQKQTPLNPAMTVLLARELERAKRLPEALDLLRRLEDPGPRDLEASLLLWRWSQLQDGGKVSLGPGVRLEESGFHHTELDRRMARNLAALGRLDDVARRLDRRTGHPASFVATLAGAVEGARSLGDASTLRWIRGLGPYSGEPEMARLRTWIRLGVAYGLESTALEPAIVAAGRMGRAAELLHYGAQAGVARGREEIASRWLSRAIDLDPSRRRGLLQALESGDEKAALHAARHGAVTQISPSRFHRYLGRTAYLSGDPARAGIHFRALEVTSLFPADRSQALAALAAASFRAGKIGDGLMALLRWVRVDRSNGLLLAGPLLLPVLFILMLGVDPDLFRRANP